MHDGPHLQERWELIADGMVARPCTIDDCRFRTVLAVPPPDEAAVARVLELAARKRDEHDDATSVLPTLLGRQLFISVAGALPRLQAANLDVRVMPERFR